MTNRKPEIWRLAPIIPVRDVVETFLTDQFLSFYALKNDMSSDGGC